MFLTFTVSMLLLITIGKKLHGQDVVFSQFFANPLYLNPAFAGSQGCTRIAMNYRNHPFPEFGTFSTYSFSADTHISRLSGGLGINLLHDNQAGLLGNTQAGISYAWETWLTDSWGMRLGLQASYINFRINAANLVFPDQYNPTGQSFASGSETWTGFTSSNNADFSAGMLVHNQRFYSGITVHHLNEPRLEIFGKEKLPAKYTLMMGYDLVLEAGGGSASGDISLSPNIILQTQSGFLRIDYGIYGHLEHLTAGVWFRQNQQHPNSLIFTLGIKQVNYAIGYSYDHSLSGFSGAGSGAHELGVLLNFNCSGSNLRDKILNCPSF